MRNQVADSFSPNKGLGQQKQKTQRVDGGLKPVGLILTDFVQSLSKNRETTR